MARAVKGRKERKEMPGFKNVVDEICRGEYVLVLGSDIMLDQNANLEAEGDSTKFFLNKVIEAKADEGLQYKTEINIKNANEIETKSIDTFHEFILHNALNPSDVRRWLLEQIKEWELEPEDITPDLIKLVATKCFRVVLTTVFDNSVEMIMDKVWGKDEDGKKKYRVMSIFNTGDKDFDFDRNELLGEEYFDVPPTLYYVFGKADPETPELKFVLDENDTIECVSRWLGKEVPAKLLSFLNTKKLLVLGCNLKDWCFRFFWYALRHKSIANLNKGDIAVLLQPEKSEQDRNLFLYLDQTVKVRLQTNSRQYIHELAEALSENNIANAALMNSKLDGIFISYANEDFAIAWNIFTRLREKGYNVWLDNRKLGVSDQYDRRIENAISQCKVFIPVLSSTVATDLTENKNRYYRKEWNLATGENSQIEYFPIVVPGYDCRGQYHQMLPEKIRKVTVFDWAKEPFSNLITKIDSSLKS